MNNCTLTGDALNREVSRVVFGLSEVTLHREVHPDWHARWPEVWERLRVLGHEWRVAAYSDDDEPEFGISYRNSADKLVQHAIFTFSKLPERFLQLAVDAVREREGE